MRSHGELGEELLLWHDVWIKVVFLPCYSRTKLQLSSTRQKHNVWTGPESDKMSSSQGEVWAYSKSKANLNLILVCIEIVCMSFGFPNMVQVLGGVKESLRTHRECVRGAWPNVHYVSWMVFAKSLARLHNKLYIIYFKIKCLHNSQFIKLKPTQWDK